MDETTASEGPTAPATVPPTLDLVERECWELLRQADVGRLAVTVDGRPDIFPVNHVVDHGTVVFRTSEGTKLAAAAGGPVAFEVDGWDEETSSAWSVVVRGRALKVLDRDETLHALRLPLVPWHTGSKPWFVRIETDEVTGRRLQLAARALQAARPGSV
ncbi:MAG: pyridoxamine 5'-phosphate oxidase family protein [Actinomycetota bacterium]|nr:pyridoxamine 5'-phosphate oxidase family protein [Actinomycetota bacterium]